MHLKMNTTSSDLACSIMSDDDTDSVCESTESATRAPSSMSICSFLFAMVLIVGVIASSHTFDYNYLAPFK